MTEPTPRTNRGRGKPRRPLRYNITLPTAILTGSLDWTSRARCLGLDPRFDTELPGESKEDTLTRHVKVARICAHCPVIDECREFAQNNVDKIEGVWGGKIYGPRIRNGRDPRKRKSYVLANDRRTKAEQKKGNSK